VLVEVDTRPPSGAPRSIGPVGAIGVVVPAGSWPVDPATQDAVRGAAQAISRELGARAWLPRGAGPDPAG
jgi:hypothetical protein